MTPVFLLFTSILFFVLAGVAVLVALDRLAHPFKDRGDYAFIIVLLAFTAPWLIVAGVTFTGQYRDYCPPVEPIAAPEIAELSAADGPPVEVPVVVDFATHADALVQSAQTIDTLTNELSAKTTALTEASATILRLTDANKALEAEVTRLKAVRIDATQRTTTPVPATPTNAPCRGPRCTRG